MTSWRAPFAVAVATVGLGCAEPEAPPPADDDLGPLLDRDSDGVGAESDCDDSDPMVWSSGTYVGDLDAASARNFCRGFCRRDVDGSVVLQQDRIERELDCLGRITGDLLVRGTVSEVTSLANVRVVEGDVVVEYLRELSELEGLQVRRIGGDLRVTNNLSLRNAPIFRGLEEIGGNLVVQGNPNLQTLGGRRLARVGGDVIVENNERLFDTTALHDVVEVGGAIRMVDNGLYVVDTFHFLESVGGPIDVTGDVGGRAFEVLEIAPTLQHGPTDRPTQIDGFDSLERVEGDLVFVGGPNGTLTLDGLGMLGRVDGDLVFDDPDVQDAHFVSGLARLASVGGSIRVGGSGLLSLDFLFNLRNVEGDLVVEDSLRFAGISSLGGLTEIGGDLRLLRNPRLDRLDGLRQLERIGGSLLVQGNPALNDLSGLSRVADIGGDLEISGNWKGLTTLDGLSGVRTVGGDLRLRFNYVLTDVSDLHTLSEVGGDVCLFANPVLPLGARDALIESIGSIGGVIDDTNDRTVCP